jgi:DNA-directed RNA polymerase specialized sigma24 family protein
MKAKFWSIEENKKLKELLLDEKAYTMLQISDIMKKSLGSVDNRKQRLFQSFTKDEKQRHMLLRTKARNTMISE